LETFPIQGVRIKGSQAPVCCSQSYFDGYRERISNQDCSVGLLLIGLYNRGLIFMKYFYKLV